MVASDPPWLVSGFRFRARLGFVIPSTFLRPARRYPRVWIWRPSFGRQRDFNPPEQRAAQRTLRGSGLLPRWDSHPLFMPAFAGRTHIRTDLPERAFGKVFRRLPYPVPGADWGRGSHRGRLRDRRARESPCRFGEIHAFGEGGPAGARAKGLTNRKARPNDSAWAPLIDHPLPPIHGLLRFPAV